MFKLQYTNAALGTLITQGASFFKRIFWKAFPVACLLAVISFVMSLAHLFGRDYVAFGFAWLFIVHRVLGICVLLLVGLLVFMLICYFLSVLMYRMYGPTQEGQVPSVGKSFAAVWAKSIKAVVALLCCIILLMLAMFIFITILSIILKSNLVMTVAFVLFAIIAIAWVVFLSLIIPVAIFENVGVFRTIGRSVRLVSRGFWKTFVVVLIAKLPSIIAYYLLIFIALIISVGVGGLAEFHTYVMMHGPLMVMSVIQIIWLIISPVLFIWSVANRLNLYHTLKNLDESLKRP